MFVFNQDFVDLINGADADPLTFTLAMEAMTPYGDCRICGDDFGST